jgi:hypothetical protein
MAQGNWTLNFSNGHLNFAEDANFAGSQFRIEVTSVTGGSFQYNDYILNYQASPNSDGYLVFTAAGSSTSNPDSDLIQNYFHDGVWVSKYQINGFPPMPASGVTNKLVITDIPGSSGGNPNSTFWLDQFVVDTDFPPPNVAPTFIGSITSISASENGTIVDVSALLHVSDSDSTQTLTWSAVSAPSHGTLDVSGATAASGGTNIGPGGTISYTPAAGFAGVDTFTVQVSDGTSTSTRTITVNVSPSSPGTPDLTQASDTGLSSTDNVTAASMLAFSGTGPAGDTTSTVRVFIDGNGNGVYDAGTDGSATATVDNGAWSVSGLSTASLASGTYNVYALITTASGGLISASSGPLAITLDKTAPSITLSGLNLSSDTGGSGSDFITSVAVQTITGTLSASLESGDRVMGSLDNGATWTDITSQVSGTTLTWSGVTLPGSNTVRLQVVDQHGNSGATSSQAYVLDTTAPTTTVGSAAFSVDSGLSVTDFVTSAAAQTISGTLSANLAAGETVQVSLNNGATWTTAVASVGSSAWSLAGVVLSGSNTLLIKVTDPAGNDGAVYAQAFVLDTTAPVLAITSDRSVLKAGETATITFTFSEDPGATFTWNGSAGDVLISGGTLGTISGSGLTRTAVFTPTTSVNGSTASIAVPGGAYADAAGNIGGAGSTHSISFDTLAPAAPIILAPANGATTNDGRPSIIGTADAGTTVTVMVDGTAVGATLVDGSGNWSFTVPTPLAGGAHTFRAQATDAAGNTSAHSSTVNATIDNAAPAVTITSGSWTDDPTPVISGTGEVDATIRLTIGGATYITTAANGTWSIDLAEATPVSGSLSLDMNGDNLVSVTATDTVGNVSTAVTQTLEIDINDLPTGAVAISGVAVKGEMLTASHTLADADGLGLIAYQWQADGADVAGATGATFILTEAQVGKAVTVKASYTDGGGHGESVTSAATAAVMLMPDPMTAPNASGGMDITITDPSQLTASLGTSGIDHVYYSGSGTVVLSDTIENITLRGSANVVGNALGNDMRSGVGQNVLNGMGGNDTLYGYHGSDWIYGGSGNDEMSGSSGQDWVYGGSGSDTVNGGSGNDWVWGDAGRDTVYGGLGNDTVNGGAGNDTLYGNAGRDTFVFDTKLNQTINVDLIKNFSIPYDSIWLDNAVFTKLGKGSAKGVKLASDMFVTSTTAQDAQDRIVYDRDTGSLYYDQDGTGSAAQVKFAALSNKAKLTYHDFFVV